ncbi:MAG: hypothetical protein K8H88_25775, partial [Sandaracinaceae bacterium]|nr:hypothetical protein [Sandaracinaceae bacterium]
PEGLAQTYSCEDTDGQNLRASGWVRGCAYLCAEGFGDSSCTTPDTQCHPYWQREFLITQEDIEAGRMLGHSGFAYGNFNYRLERLALNFVGTASRRCDDERLPSTCYTSGYIPYTIQHLPLGPGGTYRVRNYSGSTYNAPLYVGTIEHGSGLAAERYITNPISSADRGLIEPYMRDDFMGRPIDGRYVLRVWDAPGVNFDGIEDIQLVLGYRYWSRAGVPPSTSP